MSEFVTVMELAEALKVSRWWVYRELEVARKMVEMADPIPFYRRGGGYLFVLEEVKDWMKRKAAPRPSRAWDSG